MKAGNVTSSSWLPLGATVAPSVVTSMPSSRTCKGVALKPEPRILTGPTGWGAAPNVIFAAGLKFAGVPIVEPSIAGGCDREGTSSETSLVLGLKETAVLEKGWKATSAAPISGAPVVAGPVSSEKSDIELTVWLFGSMKETWLNVALGSASTALRVIGLMAMPTIEGEME